jgi:hypothetical protein
MKPILFSVLILALSACGGGGGSTAGPAPTPIPPPDTDSRSLLLPPGSEAAFVAEIKSGLEQWAGVSGDADLIDQILRLDVSYLSRPMHRSLPGHLPKPTYWWPVSMKSTTCATTAN